MERNSSAIVPIQIPASDLELSFIKPEDNYLNERWLKSIHQAWTSSAGIDNNGAVWISIDKLHIILRVQKNTVDYLVDREINSQCKRKINGKTYIKGSEVIKSLNRIIQNAGSIKREGYARYSENMYLRIRDSEDAQLQRAKRYEFIKEYRDEMRRIRIAAFDLEYCELTNEPLMDKHNDFSHIRSVSVDLELADKIWNGLVVNRQIHKIITEHFINDEAQLLDLCKDKEWSKNWYDHFNHELKLYYL
ncbi:hypothetical protein H6F62_12215 [Anabaena sp. FACHB-1391]|nr:hypothetical protein [Anabaena sp. FACHB-1391]